MDDLPKFSRLPIRPDKEPNVDQKIWFPDWQCFCCHDYGTVALHLVRLVIEDYDHGRDKAVTCQRCSAGSYYLNNENYDPRFSRGLCDRLDKIERDGWIATVKAKQRQINLKALAKKMAMPGTRDRSDNDNREVQQRKAEIEAIPHEQWITMGNSYLGDVSEYCEERDATN